MTTPIEIISNHPKSEEFKTILFWANTPFSQWWLSDVIIDGFTFNCTEQYMMFKKATVFGDYTIATKVLETNNPKEQKALGRQVRNFDNDIWGSVARDIVFRANIAKFTQNRPLLAALLSTDGYTLVEASPYDAVWGIKMSETDPNAFDSSKWKGKNWLGQVLTEVRESII